MTTYRLKYAALLNTTTGPDKNAWRDHSPNDYDTIEIPGLKAPDAEMIVWNEVPSGIQNGHNTTFTLQGIPIPDRISVYLNGLLQTINNDYGLMNDQIIFEDAPLVGDSILVNYSTT